MLSTLHRVRYSKPPIYVTCVCNLPFSASLQPHIIGPSKNPLFPIAGADMQNLHPCFRVLASIIFAFATLFPLGYAQPRTNSQSFPFMNPALPLDQRLNDLIGRMTLEEKVS